MNDRHWYDRQTLLSLEYLNNPQMKPKQQHSAPAVFIATWAGLGSNFNQSWVI